MPVPRFEVGTSLTPVNRIRTFRPSGSLQEAQLWSDVAQQFDKVSHTFGEIERKRNLAMAEEVGQVAGADAEFDPNELPTTTTADRLYKKAALESYTARLSMDTDRQLAEIEQQTFDSPDGMQQRMYAFIDQTAQSMPKDVAVRYRLAAQQRAETKVLSSFKRHHERVRENAKKDVLALVEMSEENLISFGVPQDEADSRALGLEFSKYSVALDSAVESGYLSQNEALLRRQKLERKQQESFVYDEMQRSDNPLAYAIQVAAGKSGTVLDTLNPRTRLQAVQVAQQVHAARQQQRGLMREAAQRQRAAQWLSFRKEVHGNPALVKPETLVQLREAANSNDEFNEVLKMEDYVKNYNEKRFNETSPAAKALISRMRFDGKVTEELLDALHGNEDLSINISTSDYNAEMERRSLFRENIESRNIWQVWKQQIDMEMPGVPQNIKNYLMTQAMSGSYVNEDAYLKRTLGDDMALFQWQDKQKDAIMLRALRAVADGKINSDDDLDLFMRDEMQKARAEMNQLQIRQQRSQEVKPQDGRLKFYKENYDRFEADVKDGKVDGALKEQVKEYYRANGR